MITDLNGHPVGIPNFYGMAVAPGRPDRIAADELHADPEAWARKAILNVAGSGRFSSDRTIAEYADQIWRVKPCPVP